MNQLKQKITPEYKIFYRGDCVRFHLKLDSPLSGKAFLRTNLGRLSVRCQEIAEHVSAVQGRDWHDVPMGRIFETEFTLSLPLTETGSFSAKAWFLADGQKKPLWPEGENITFKVEPPAYVCGSGIYTAFARQFGPRLAEKEETQNDLSDSISRLDEKDYVVIPPSGTFRALIDKLDFITGTLHSRIIQLLPIHPTPVTFGRMGRFGSPFASLDYFAVDPALAEFDKKTTPLDQFVELVDAVHARGAQLFLDIPVNHTGWASRLHLEHPDWFKRNADQSFASPGAWGVVWADLVELDYSKTQVADYMAEVFLYWLRLGVDGFRCDAGYKIPFEAWKVINAKIRLEYPDAILLLEGLGGPLDLQKKLLESAGLNWAYSELFQNYTKEQIEPYLRYCETVNSGSGLMVHFAETHDNNRLALVSKEYSVMRTAFSALLSYNGTLGITNGVEWFATQKIDVHGAAPLNWGSSKNQITQIRRLQVLLSLHPAFFARSSLRLLENDNADSISVVREDAVKEHKILILINLNESSSVRCRWPQSGFPITGETLFDLLSGRKIVCTSEEEQNGLTIEAQQVLCLTTGEEDLRQLELAQRRTTYSEPEYALRQRIRAELFKVITEYQGLRDVAAFDVEQLAAHFTEKPEAFCAQMSASPLPPLTTWTEGKDQKRIVLLPADDLLIVKCSTPFRAEIKNGVQTVEAGIGLPSADGRYFYIFKKQKASATVSEYRQFKITVYESGRARPESGILLLLPAGDSAQLRTSFSGAEIKQKNGMLIAANYLGGMSQIRADWGSLRSKYDAVLAANGSPDFPVDRRVLFTRLRAWVVSNDYSTELNLKVLRQFTAGTENSARWQFLVPAGQGKTVALTITFQLALNANALRLRFERPEETQQNDFLPQQEIPLKIILRPDLEDRINHEVTKAYQGAEEQFKKAVQVEKEGFLFAPHPERALRVELPGSDFIWQPEWSYMHFLAEEEERGLEANTDLFSPGYFEFYLENGETRGLSARAEFSTTVSNNKIKQNKILWPEISLEQTAPAEQAALSALKRFIVKRDQYQTIIAGYPWFLDWGRDTLISLRGVISAGLMDESRNIIKQFSAFEQNGTIPNVIRGADNSNRETSDAPLWLFKAVEDFVEHSGNDAILQEDCGGRTLLTVLESIVRHYVAGTSTGIKMDKESGLIFSPPHFTWMDTNYPAGTPREGYPIEIQALWVSALRFISRTVPKWKALQKQAENSIAAYFWLPEKKYLSDCLHISYQTPVAKAEADDACRSNQLFAVTLGAVTDAEMQKNIVASCEQLIVPGAIRSLADMPLSRPLPVSWNGQLLNNPRSPYFGRYEGDEDTRRKPAYHNGTAWTWPFPSYVEALYKILGEDGRSRCRALLLSSRTIMEDSAVGFIPEICDGSAPHQLRGCGAQAWGVSEFYRVLKLLS